MKAQCIGRFASSRVRVGRQGSLYGPWAKAVPRHPTEAPALVTIGVGESTSGSTLNPSCRSLAARIDPLLLGAGPVDVYDLPAGPAGAVDIGVGGSLRDRAANPGCVRIVDGWYAVDIDPRSLGAPTLPASDGDARLADAAAGAVAYQGGLRRERMTQSPRDYATNFFSISAKNASASSPTTSKQCR